MFFLKTIKYIIETLNTVLKLYVSIHHDELVEGEDQVVEGGQVEQVLVILGGWPEAPVVFTFYKYSWSLLG